MLALSSPCASPRPETRHFDFEELDALDPVASSCAVAAKHLYLGDAAAEQQASEDSDNACVGGQVCGLDAYRLSVMKALHNDVYFATFKRDPQYQVVLEHVWPSLGAEYLACVHRDAPQLLDQLMNDIRRNNIVGSPILYDYPGIGAVSPTQLRYLKVLVDLQLLFVDKHSLENLSIIELGVGYGGQCQLVLAAHSVASYILADLPEVELLAQRYLRATVSAHRLGVVRLRQELPSDLADVRVVPQADLFLSNYAFSELNHELQCKYFDELVRPCRRGYVTYNNAADAAAMPVRDFAAKLRSIGRLPSVEPEKPGTAENCFIVKW